MTSYIKFQILFLWLPLLLLWIFHWKTLQHYPKTIGLTTLATVIFGVPWDTLSVITGLWWYDSSPTLGIWLGPYLPLEEHLFTLTFPVLAAGTILALRRRLRA
jgi:lycopene cyclase domain-containing protein